jgi:hypothetical protein
LFKPFKCKVLILVSNVPVHVWSVEVIQAILGSSCLVFDVDPRSRDELEMDNFIVVAWASDPELILTGIGFSIPELVNLPEVGVTPLFLWASEIIHSLCNLLHYHAIVNVLEIHDFSTPLSSDSEGGRRGSDSGPDDDGYPGYYQGHNFLDSWSVVRCYATGARPSGLPWPSLPSIGNNVSDGMGATTRPVSHRQLGPRARTYGYLPTNGSLFQTGYAAM